MAPNTVSNNAAGRQAGASVERGVLLINLIIAASDVPYARAILNGILIATFKSEGQL